MHNPSSLQFPERYQSRFMHLLLSSPAPAVAHVELARPAALNAFIPALWLELGQAFRVLSTDSDVRAVILSGSGDRAFTSGLDLTWAMVLHQELFPSDHHNDPSRVATQMRRHLEEFQEAIGWVEKCEKRMCTHCLVPLKAVICVMHGICFGLAIDIACCADIRLCSQDATLSVKEVDMGIAADIGTLARLPKIVGNHSWIKDVCMTARPFSAQEAVTHGFVSQVFSDKAQALEHAMLLAALMAAKSPVAVQGTKEILNHARDHSVADTSLADMAQDLKYTAVWNAAMIQSQDFKIALEAFRDKRAPIFAKL